MIKSAAEGFAGKSAADSIPLTSCPCRCRDPRCVCNGNIPAKYRRSQRTAFPLPLHWAASKTARVRHLAASVACLWQTANVINGFITQSHKRRAAHSWQEARHVETERHITTSVVTNYDTDRSQTAAGEPGTFSYQQVTPPPTTDAFLLQINIRPESQQPMAGRGRLLSARTWKVIHSSQKEGTEGSMQKK